MVSSTTTSARRLASTGRLGAADDAEALLGGEPRHLVEALGMARRDDQQRVRPARLDAAEGVERRAAPRRAACWRQSPPGALGDTRKKRSTRSRLWPCGPTPGQSSESNFRLPVTTTRARSAPRSTIRRAASSLCMQKRSTSASTRRKKRRTSAIAGERARRDAAVDEHRGHAALAAVAQQHRPDLGLHHHEQPRPDDVERAADGEAPVERKVEDAVDVGQLPRHFVAGHASWSRGRASSSGSAFELADERARGQRLPHRDGVDPDGLSPSTLNDSGR